MPRGKTITPEDIAQWEIALDEGMSYKHIGEMFGVHKETISKHLPGRGWTREQMGSFSQLVQRNASVLG